MNEPRCCPMCGCDRRHEPAGSEPWRAVAAAYATEYQKITGRDFQTARYRNAFELAAQAIGPDDPAPLVARFFADPDPELRRRGYPPGWLHYRVDAYRLERAGRSEVTRLDAAILDAIQRLDFDEAERLRKELREVCDARRRAARDARRRAARKGAR